MAGEPESRSQGERSALCHGPRQLVTWDTLISPSTVAPRKRFPSQDPNSAIFLQEYQINDRNIILRTNFTNFVKILEIFSGKIVTV